MPSRDAPDDDAVRQTTNFAPGYFGLVYREERAAGGKSAGENDEQRDDGAEREQHDDENDANDALDDAPPEANASHDDDDDDASQDCSTPQKTYTLSAMKWGLIPFWTKRSPDYASMLRTINCRDDSLAQKGGMWASMKKSKRCIVLAQGFYEWFKKGAGGREKVPHFVKRRDGQLMCFAGLWDSVRYEDTEAEQDAEGEVIKKKKDPLYTYTIITTHSNPQLNFLHDRMPVILDNGSADMFAWLDSGRTEWTPALQGLLKPFAGELDVYPVPRDVGKVGNDSPEFMLPISESKQNIARFFGRQAAKQDAAQKEEPVQDDEKHVDEKPAGDDDVLNTDEQPAHDHEEQQQKGTKRAHPSSPVSSTPSKIPRHEPSPSPSKTTPSKPSSQSKSPTKSSSTRSATRNTQSSSPASKKAKGNATAAGDGSLRITNFFGK